MQSWKIATAAGAAGVVLLGGGVAYAADTTAGTAATTPSPSASPGQTSPNAKPNAKKRAHRRPIPRRVVHGTFTVRTRHGFKTVAAQRGRVTAVTGNTVTVTSPDRQTHRYITNADTRVRLDRAKSDRSKIAKGLHAYVLTSARSGTSVARLVVLRHPR